MIFILRVENSDTWNIHLSIGWFSDIFELRCLSKSQIGWPFTYHLTALSCSFDSLIIPWMMTFSQVMSGPAEYVNFCKLGFPIPMGKTLHSCLLPSQK